MTLQTYSVVSRALTVVAVIVAMATGAWAQTETIIHTFTGGSDGGIPFGGLIIDGKGNLYGTTVTGGVGTYCQCGTVFQLVPGSNGTWTKNILYSFSSSSNLSDGLSPQGLLVLDGKGNLYGTAAAGGTGAGLVFKLSPGSSGTWTETTLYSFAGGSDGESPSSGVAFDGKGNLYGAAYGGTAGYGIVFELVNGGGGAWTKKTLYNFTDANDGAGPQGTLVFDNEGDVYGAAGSGGAHDYGVVFELSPGSAGWTEKVLYSLTGGSGGSFPQSGLVSMARHLFGVAGYNLFELTPGSGGIWTEKTLHNFVGGTDGADALGALTYDPTGNLYGTTSLGGAHHGTVFELTPSATGTPTETILHSFAPDGVDGVNPNSSLVVDAAGNVYGTTANGGSDNQGVVFEITP
jgi:uncharacterized repeat protein (TIGR03803 family)